MFLLRVRAHEPKLPPTRGRSSLGCSRPSEAFSARALDPLGRPSRVLPPAELPSPPAPPRVSPRAHARPAGPTCGARDSRAAAPNQRSPPSQTLTPHDPQDLRDPPRHVHPAANSGEGTKQSIHLDPKRRVSSPLKRERSSQSLVGSSPTGAVGSGPLLESPLGSPRQARPTPLVFSALLASRETLKRAAREQLRRTGRWTFEALKYAGSYVSRPRVAAALHVKRKVAARGWRSLAPLGFLPSRSASRPLVLAFGSEPLRA